MFAIMFILLYNLSGYAAALLNTIIDIERSADTL
jgi:hypothetical protein